MREPPAIPVSAERIATGLEDWIVDELKGRSARYFDLGKFLFTVSSGVILFFTTALTALGTHGCSKKWLVVCAALAVLGILAGIALVWPRNTSIGPQLDALSEFNAAMARCRALLLVWTAVTVLALTAGMLTLVEIGPSCTIWSGWAPASPAPSAPAV